MSASLMVDLQGINLDSVDQARKAISGAIASPELKKILEGGAFQTALGGLGTALSALQSKTPDATAILGPIVEAIGLARRRVDLEHVVAVEIANFDFVHEGVLLAVELLHFRSTHEGAPIGWNCEAVVS